MAASLLTVLNYAILVGYDWFAVRWVGEKDLPLRKIALASFTGYAFSYNFGATLFGTSIRYRLYSAWGMPLLKDPRPAGDPRADVLVRSVHAGRRRVRRASIPDSRRVEALEPACRPDVLGGRVAAVAAAGYVARQRASAASR